jgi:hypothetical protein
MVNFSWNWASDYRTIWILDKLVHTTIGGGQNGYHFKTGPVFRWLKQDGSRKCFNHLKTGPVFRWSTLWNRAFEYLILICSVFKWFLYSAVRYSDPYCTVVLFIYFSSWMVQNSNAQGFLKSHFNAGLLWYLDTHYTLSTTKYQSSPDFEWSICVRK